MACPPPAHVYNFGKDRDNLTVRVSSHVKAYIKARGEPYNATMSEFAAMVFDWWLAQGAPAVHTMELGRTLAPIPDIVKDELEWDKIPTVSSTNHSDDPAAAARREQAKRAASSPTPSAKKTVARPS